MSCGGARLLLLGLLSVAVPYEEGVAVLDDSNFDEVTDCNHHAKWDTAIALRNETLLMLCNSLCAA